jgi:mannose-6-phosphate isomerase-like protein (cupin superfamily)
MRGVSESRAAQYEPGAVFEGLSMRSTLLELSEEAFRTDVEAGPDASGGPLHRHMHQSERFVVSEGTLEVRTGLRGRRRVRPGEDVLIPPATPHTFSVLGDSARFEAEFRPSLRVADYFLELMELDSVGLRDLARLAQRYPDEHFYLPIVPPAAQRLLLKPLA